MKQAIKILIVEDEYFIAKAMEIILTKKGFEVCSIFSKGEDVLQWIHDNHPDLILMDIQLAGKLDGIETSEQILLHVNVPIIFMTAYNNEEIVERAMKLNPLAFFNKPINFNQLDTIINKHLQ